MQDAEKPLLEDCVGWGLDIVPIAKMERVLDRTPGIRLRAFTEGEREYCERSNAAAVHYATRFAAKQAVLKALGMNILSGIALKDIEVLRTGKGRPSVCLHGRAAREAKGKGVLEMPISLSFTHSEAVGCAMAVTADSVHAARKRTDPLHELSVQFKEARAMLDELPATRAGESASNGSPGGLGEGGTCEAALAGACGDGTRSERAPGDAACGEAARGDGACSGDAPQPLPGI